jgi:adenine-specific DNA-methyltransferase
MLGQFFTKNELLKNKVYEFILNDPSEILEPSCGRGDLVVYVNSKLPNIKFDLYEIDEKIDFLVNKKQIIFGDFLKQNISKTYTTIVGNPPYVRTQKGNLYIDFIEKCFNLLKPNGELIFIIPSDFFKLTCSANLLIKMLEQGTFTHIYHPDNENLFEGATIDIVIFRYYKNKDLEKKVVYNGKTMYLSNNAGLITFDSKITKHDTKYTFDYFDIYVGFVSGKDSVFQSDDLGNVDILWNKNKIKKFILIDKFPSEDKKINSYLLKNKDQLLDRKIRNFNEKNWFKWAGLRNISKIQENEGKPCIYLRNMSRKNEIAFVGKVDYFGPGLFMLLPKENVNLVKVVDYFNSEEFRKHFTYSNRFKIGLRQLGKSILLI